MSQEEQPKPKETIQTGNDEVEIKPDSPLDKFWALPPRLIGSIFIALAAVFGKFEIYDKLDAAQHHAPEIRYSMKMIFVIVIFATIGLMMLIGGRAAERLLTKTGDDRPSTWLDKVLLGVCLAFGFGLFLWIQNMFSQLGYK